MTATSRPTSAAPPSLLHTQVLAVLPHRYCALARLDALSPAPAFPVVAVVGKYNQGKSRLLNELCGNDVFAVADRRETIEVSHYDASGTRWMDAPGLDADVAGDDDRQAAGAIWVAADIRLLVHAAKEGELDAAEVTLAQALLANDAVTGRRSLLVVTQIDQVPDAAVLAGIIGRIVAQVPDVSLHAVSALRHRKGRDGVKPLLINASGMPALSSLLQAMGMRVPAARAAEVQRSVSSLLGELDTETTSRLQLLRAHQAQAQQAREAFLHGLAALFMQAAADVETLDADEARVALRPDAHAERYIMTAAKRARTKQQLVYSRINLRLSAYLTGHAVQMQLPDPGAMPAGLNTVMVAVLGVAVKYRDELRRMFCEPVGAQRLQSAFTHYYDGSATRRQALAEIEALHERAAQAVNAAAQLRQTYAMVALP